MKFFALFINRPVATTLLTLAIALAGMLGFRLLPVAPLPQVDFPVIVISASLPGAAPEIMASSVATPLERSLGRIAGVSEMTSTVVQYRDKNFFHPAIRQDIEEGCFRRPPGRRGSWNERASMQPAL